MPHQSLHRSGASFWMLPGFLLVFLSLLTVIWLAPDIPYPQQDSAWGLAINQAVADRLAFGREILFTLGPWGAVYTGQYHPATDGMMLAGGAIVALALAAGLLALAKGGRLWFVLLAPLLVVTVGQRDPVFLALPLLLVAVATAISGGGGRTRGVAALLMLTAACALLSFVKGTFGTGAVPMVALAVLALLIGRLFWLAGSMLALYATALTGFWLLAGQRLADLPIYFGSIPVVIEGYAEGMALGGPWTDIAAYGGGSAVLLWLLWRDRPRSRPFETMLLLLGLLFTLFIAFKSGFVRHDEHALIAAGTLAMMPVVLVQALRVRSLAIAALVSLSALAFIGHHYKGYEWPSAHGRDRLTLAVSGAWTRVTDPGRLRRLFDAEMAAVRVAAALPPVAGPTDIYSSGQMILLANGLQWSPRPALQSVTVFNRMVEKADLDVLEDGSGARPPVQNVFYRVESEDNRLRSTQDGLSWPALLTEFRVVSYDRALDMALLQRKPGARAAQPSNPALLSIQSRLGKEVVLPASPTGLTWTVLDFQPTLIGRLASFLFRLPVLSVAVRYADGTVEHARLASGPAGAGFLLSPRISDTSDMLRLLLPERRAPEYRPVSIAVTGESGTRWLWRPWFGVTLQSIAIPVQDQVREMLAPAKLTPLTRPLPDAGMAELCTIELVDGRPPSAKPVDVQGIAQVSGWSIISLPHGEAPDRVVVRLTDANHVWETVAEPRSRPDVGGYFVNPALTPTGFDARFDVSSLAGAYTLTIVAERGQSSWQCKPTQGLLVHAPDTTAASGG